MNLPPPPRRSFLDRFFRMESGLFWVALAFGVLIVLLWLGL